MNKFALTTIAALPQAGGQASSLPAEVGKKNQLLFQTADGEAATVQMKAPYFDWEAETPLPVIDLGLLDAFK